MFPPKHPRKNGQSISRGRAEMTTTLNPTRLVVRRRVVVPIPALAFRVISSNRRNIIRNGRPPLLATQTRFATKLP